jgi:hypothetical protein
MVGQVVAFLRLPLDSSIYKLPGVQDYSPGPNSPQFELIFGDGFAGALEAPPEEGNFLTIGVIDMSPSSRGSVILQSSDPFVAPLIDPKLLGEKIDVQMSIEGMISSAFGVGGEGFLTSTILLKVSRQPENSSRPPFLRITSSESTEPSPPPERTMKLRHMYASSPSLRGTLLVQQLSPRGGVPVAS